MKSGDVHYPKTNSSHRSNENNPGCLVYIIYTTRSYLVIILKNHETMILSKEEVDSKRQIFSYLTGHPTRLIFHPFRYAMPG